jgi:regulatory protein
MKILNIIKKKRKNECLVVFDDNNEISLSMDLVLKHNLAQNSIINEEELKLINDEQKLINAKQAAYNYASYKPRTKEQVKKKLKEKGYIESIIYESIKFLTKFELLDDNKYANTFAKEYALLKKAGPKKVELELISRGIEPNIAKDAVYRFYPNDDKFDIALEAAEKKYRTVKNKPKEKIYRSIRDNLLRKGFESDIIKEVISKIMER